MSFFQRLKAGLARTHQNLIAGIGRIVTGDRLTDAGAEELAELLIAADLGVGTAELIVERVRKERGHDGSGAEVVRVARETILDILRPVEAPLVVGHGEPWTVMMVGVNGSGKTTTTAKLGHRWMTAGHSVAFAAADTFRAGAVEQLGIWAERTGAHFYRGTYGADPSSVVFDAMNGARARGTEILLIDTAGRLHTSSNLMAELQKVHRTCGKVLSGAPHETILVLDATTGQNAIRQAQVFGEALGGLTGIALTKLDGTAKGGIVVAIARELGVPVKLIGVGEKEEDLQDFKAAEFVEALFSA